MNARLVEFAALIRSTSGLPDVERYEKLLDFVVRRDRSPTWYNRLPAAEKGLWAEARALIVVSLALANEAQSMSQPDLDRDFYGKRPRFRWEELEVLTPELAGESPNHADERWVDGVKERLLVMLRARGEPWTKAHARVCSADLARETGQYRKDYRDLARWAVDQGTGE